jgi:outer membrane protein assembly factor BamA
LNAGFLSAIKAQDNQRFELIEISFKGNKSFSNSELLNQLESKVSPWWFWTFLKSFTPFGSEKIYFDSLNIPIDKQALKDFYITNGFFQTEVHSSYIIDTLKKNVILTYIIEEGRSSVFNKLNLVGFDKLSQLELQNVYDRFSSISAGKRFNQSLIEKSINDVLRFLTNNGYILAKYDSAVVIKDTSRFIADVNIYFNVGDKYYLNGIRIIKSGSGAANISDDLIKGISSFSPGEIYDQSKLERSELRLLRTGLFNSISINPVIKDTQDFLVPIEILAQVSNLNEISPELKVDNEFNSFNSGLGLNLIRKNFLGSARKLTISTSFRLIDVLNFNFKNILSSKTDSTYQGITDLEIGLEQPYLFGRTILTSTKAYFRSSKFKSNLERLVGANQSLDFEMPTYTFITLLKPQFFLELVEYEFDFRNIETKISAKSLTPSLGVELGSYKTDNLIFPNRGYNWYFYPELFQSRTDVDISVSDSITSVIQTGWYWKIQTSFSHFTSVSRDKNGTLGVKLKLGYVQSIKGSYDLIPPNKTFYGGGSNSLRGWRSRELLPEDEIIYFGIRSNRDNTPRGGTFQIDGSVEFRRKFLEDFGFATFFDFGNVWNSYKNISFNQLALSYGLGFRYYSPIAPFRIDFGLKFYNPKDKSFIFNKKFLTNLEFHFGIGEAF